MVNPHTTIIDAFAAAVAALGEHAPAEKVASLAQATSALLEDLASRAASQSAGAFVKAYTELHRADNDLRMIVEHQAVQLIDHEQRLHALERGKDASNAAG